MLLMIISLMVAVLTFSVSKAHSIPKKFGAKKTPSDADQWYEEDRGYASVRNGAHLFWWMYYKTDAGRHRPLLLWLQGGPGASAGYGDIDEIGPKTLDGTERNNTWLKQTDLIFIDNPVGAGFSYVTDQSALTRNLNDIVNDLISWAKIFFTEHPKFRSRPFYIAGQSYGGKVSAAFAKALHHQITNEDFNVNFKGIMLVGAWISPMDFLFSYGSYLNAHSRISTTQSKKLTEAASSCDSKATSWEDRAQCFGESQMMIMEFEKDINFYNVNEVSTYEDDVTTFTQMRNEKNFPNDDLIARFASNASYINYYARFYLKMNYAVKRGHGIIPENITWNFYSQSIFDAHLQSDFMMPVIEEISYLLENTSVSVSVLSGQYDLICNVLGSEAWVEKLKWSHLTKFHMSNRKVFYSQPDTKEPAGFKQKYKNFQFFWILKAGHAVPADAPETALHVLHQILHPHLHEREESSSDSDELDLF